MSAGKSWEVCLLADEPEPQVWCREFRSRRRARRFMKSVLKKDEEFYCATISDENGSAFEVYYWNGEKIIPWKNSTVLSSRQVRLLLGD